MKRLSKLTQKEADIALLKQCIKKQDAGPFVKRYTPVVTNTIRSMAKKRNRKISKEDVDDLIQTAFLEFFKNDWKRLRLYVLPPYGMMDDLWKLVKRWHMIIFKHTLAPLICLLIHNILLKCIKWEIIIEDGSPCRCRSISLRIVL